MKFIPKKILKVLALFALMLWLGPVFSQPTLQKKEMREMIGFALNQLPSILERIPVNEEKMYGFGSRKEFKRAVLGIPYQEYSLDRDIPTGNWGIIVTVDNENRVLIRLRKQKGKWVFTGFGAPRLATELGFFARQLASNKPSWGRIVRDFEMKCDYLQFEPESETQLTGIIHPLESAARLILRCSDSINKNGYAIEQIKELRVKLKRLSVENTPYEVR